MAWPSVEGSCEEAGDACSSGWLKRCEKGQAQLIFLLPPLSAAGLISYSRHAGASALEWEFGEQVTGQCCPGGIGTQHTPCCTGTAHLPHCAPIRHPLKKTAPKKKKHTTWPVQPGVQISEKANQLTCCKLRWETKCLNQDPIQKLSLCMIILCLTILRIFRGRYWLLSLRSQSKSWIVQCDKSILQRHAWTSLRHVSFVLQCH